ncbi:MAG: hypothetical protein ACXV2I_12020 [Actinomycetes bacterium]
MTQTDDRIRELLHGLAEDVRPAPFLARLDRQSAALRRRRRLVAAATAAAVAVAAVAGGLLIGRSSRAAEHLPSDRPPKVFRLTDLTSSRPGRASLAVTLASSSLSDKPVYLVPAGGGAVVAVPSARTTAKDLFSQRLSRDGRYLLRDGIGNMEPPGVLLNLVTGQTQPTRPNRALSELSPDNRTLAVYLERAVGLVDTSTGHATRLRSSAYRLKGNDLVGPQGARAGWSPDGHLLAFREPQGLVVVNGSGQVRRRVPGANLVNGSMSWAPSGDSFLVYLQHQRRFALGHLTGGPPAALRTPADVAKPVGWAGDQVVWLVGAPGAQRLVTTDRHGDHPRTWMRFEVGQRGVESVTWSRALSG